MAQAFVEGELGRSLDGALNILRVFYECQGQADAVDDEVWTFERCMLQAYGDVVVEVLFCYSAITNGAMTHVSARWPKRVMADGSMAGVGYCRVDLPQMLVKTTSPPTPDG